jgi:hypothetical protein
MYSVDGREVFSSVYTSERMIIQTENFERGVYFLKIGNATQKVVLE